MGGPLGMATESTPPPPERTTEDAPPWIDIARGELARGVRETAGAAATPRILEYFGATRLRVPPEGDETPWCAAFVGWCLERAGVAGTGKANARSYLDWGVPLMEARLGCVVVFSRGDNKAQGHVGFWVGETPGQDAALVLGGNQGNRVSVAPYPYVRVLGWRWPAPAP